MIPLEENDIASNSNIDDDSSAETERDSTTQVEPESGGDEESISSVSDIMSDAVCAFFKESSLEIYSISTGQRRSQIMNYIEERRLNHGVEPSEEDV